MAEATEMIEATTSPGASEAAVSNGAGDLVRLRRYWHPVAREDEVADGPVGVELLGERLVLVPSGEGIAAFADVCPHRGAKISMGWMDNGNVVCPYHGLTYDTATGRCVYVPSQPKDRQHIPSRFTLRPYRSAVKYGLVWVALAQPEAPLPSLPEAEQPEYRVHYGFERSWRTSAARYIENAMDLSHFPFVHPGSLGDREHPEMEPFPVERTATGLHYEYDWEFQQPEMSEHYGAQVHYEYHLDFPFTVRIKLTTNFGRTVIFTTACPAGRDSIRLWVVFARDYAFDRDDHEWIDFSSKVWAEDQEVVEEQRPEMLPVDLSEEVHLRAADAAGIAYRRLLRESGLSYA